jgi:HNH endonuclease
MKVQSGFAGTGQKNQLVAGGRDHWDQRPADAALARAMKSLGSGVCLTGGHESLRQQILRRDGWRCQSCGTITNLEVNHREFHSHSEANSEENLITLCTACHAIVHRP